MLLENPCARRDRRVKNVKNCGRGEQEKGAWEKQIENFWLFIWTELLNHCTFYQSLKRSQENSSTFSENRLLHLSEIFLGKENAQRERKKECFRLPFVYFR